MTQGRRIAVLTSEGQQAKWPADLEVKQYDSTARGAAKVAAMMKAGTIDAVVIANKTPNSNVIRLMPKTPCPVFLWQRSLPALAGSIHEVVGLSKMPVLVKPEPEKTVKRDPKWTLEENEAILVAYSECGDEPEMFRAIYNELVERERNAAELWLHCDNLRRQGYLRTPESFVEALKPIGKTAEVLPVPEIDREVDFAAALKQAILAGVLTVDEAIDRAIARGK
jgi:hypothetical protein